VSLIKNLILVELVTLTNAHDTVVHIGLQQSFVQNAVRKWIAGANMAGRIQAAGGDINLCGFSHFGGIQTSAKPDVMSLRIKRLRQNSVIRVKLRLHDWKA
jgi:hypothetical protein